MSDESKIEPERRRVGTLERHAQTLALALITGFIVWGVSTVSETKQQVAVMNVLIAQLAEKIDDLAMIKKTVADHEVRLRLLEKP